MSRTTTAQKWSLASVALRDAYTDFMPSRRALNCTLCTAGKFSEWIESRGVTDPQEGTARHVREYIAELVKKGKKDPTVWDHARAAKTMLVFWHNEGYISTLIRLELPELAEKRLHVRTAEQLKQIVKACNVRDKSIVLFMADSGLQRAEVCALSWKDVDMQSGLVIVKQGKGRKDRCAVIGVSAREFLSAQEKEKGDDERRKIYQIGIDFVFHTSMILRPHEGSMKCWHFPRG